MRSCVEIHAECDAQGRTHLTRLWAEGALGVRKTGDTHVHLVGTAAGPIGADSIHVSITVGAGARLSVEGVAATIALQGAVLGAGELRQSIVLAKNARLHLALPALIVTRDAMVSSRTEITACASAELVVIEQVSLGRFKESGGQWAGRMLADVDGNPILRQTQTSESVLLVLAQESEDAFAGGAIVSRLELGSPMAELPTINTHGNAMVAVLEGGGALHTSVGQTLALAHRDLRELEQMNQAAPPIQTQRV